jgi:hypothetical protein
MTESYNPIVRTFCQLRAGLLDCLEVDRREIRPGTPLASLVPEPSRRDVWRHLQRQGLRPPPLEFSERDRGRITWSALRAAVSLAIGLRHWSALLLVFPLGLFANWAHRRRAVQLPLGLTTVGELVLAMTCFADHKASGYRWTRNEIELKVRLILADSLGVPLEDVRPECTLHELDAMGTTWPFGGPARRPSSRGDSFQDPR